MNKANINRLFRRTLPEVIGILLAIFGFVGFIASADLSIEKVKLLKDPTYEPTCNLSPLLSCGSVMVTPQAEVFGFPNPFIGVAGFAVVTTIGMVIIAGAHFKRWFWLGLQVGSVFGVLFVTWLQFQSIFRIGALCPWCMVVWVVTIPIFIYVLCYNLREGHIKTGGIGRRVGDFVQCNHGNILLYWYGTLFMTILIRFWDYWRTLL